LVTPGLQTEQIWLRIPRVDAQNPIRYVGQTVRRIDPVRFNIQPNARTRNQVSIDAISYRLKLRIRPTKPLVVPKVNTGLILDFDIYLKVTEKTLSRGDNLIFCLPRQVIIKIKNIVILYAPLTRQVCLMIPDRLEKAACCEKALT